MFKKTIALILFFILLLSSNVYSIDLDAIELIDNYEALLKEYTERIDALELENNSLKESNAYLQRIITDGIAEKIPVLTYHHLFDEDLEKSVFKNNRTVISLDAFETQMKYLYEKDYYTATLQELELFIKGELNLPKKTVVITFDDGYRSNIELAYPILQKYKFKATIFVIGEYIGISSWLTYLSLEDMKITCDVFQFENHTNKLYHVVNGKALMISHGKEKVKEDLLYLKELLDTKYFAYPFGLYNQTAIEALKETNHAMAFTTKYGYVTRKSILYELPRLGISSKTTLKDFQNIVNVK